MLANRHLRLPQVRLERATLRVTAPVAPIGSDSRRNSVRDAVLHLRDQQVQRLLLIRMRLMANNEDNEAPLPQLHVKERRTNKDSKKTSEMG